jgi:hypothetical protein
MDSYTISLDFASAWALPSRYEGCGTDALMVMHGERASFSCGSYGSCGLCWEAELGWMHRVQR